MEHLARPASSECADGSCASVRRPGFSMRGAFDVPIHAVSRYAAPTTPIVAANGSISLASKGEPMTSPKQPDQRPPARTSPDSAKSSTTWQSQIDESGSFDRRPTSFRQSLSGEAQSPFQPQPDRYHLYVSLACPWAHRTLLTRKLKGLEHVISVDVVDTFLAEGGWTLSGKEPGATGDRVNGFKSLREAYLQTDPEYSGGVTVPVLWDKSTKQIVNNESSEIIRQFNAEFQALAKHPEIDLYPEAHRERIDELNQWIYSDINNGVYQCGFARTQQAYDKAVGQLFAALDRVEHILSRSRFLTGDRFTEADIRLFPTLVRFDLVYNTHFKCNVRRILDYPNLWGYTRDMYAIPGVSDTIDVDHIKRHYYRSHDTINPFRIIPAGPDIDFTEKQDRAARFGS